MQHERLHLYGRLQGIIVHLEQLQQRIFYRFRQRKGQLEGEEHGRPAEQRFNMDYRIRTFNHFIMKNPVPLSGIFLCQSPNILRF